MTLKLMSEMCSALAVEKLTANYFNVLCKLQEGRMNMTKLARICNHSTSAATGIVDRMEKMGWVTRHIGEDRRKVEVELTAKGKRKFESVVDAVKG